MTEAKEQREYLKQYILKLKKEILLEKYLFAKKVTHKKK